MAWTLDLFDPVPSPQDVRAELVRILESNEFARAARLRELLQYAVTCVLEGREEQLSSHAIAGAVFGRQVYDPETDSIVRTEAARLRERLDRYYAQSGRHDRVRISLNRGDYLPLFLEWPPRGRWQRLPARLRAALLVAMVALFALLLLLMWAWR